MKREEALSILQGLMESGDTEAAHGTADEVLCKLLSSLGYQDVVDAWERIDKWYA